MTTISNADDVIDSRDVIARIEELSDLAANLGADDDGVDIWQSLDYQEERAELAALEALAKQGEDYAPDWEYGETLIRDSYFEDYARELADDIGAVKSDAAWPNNCIDWKEAARQLQQDYTSIDFDGVTYWIR